MDLAKGMFYFFLIGFIIMIANSISIYHLEFSQRKILNISVSEKKLFSKAVKLFKKYHVYKMNSINIKVKNTHIQRATFYANKSNPSFFEKYFLYNSSYLLRLDYKTGKIKDITMEQCKNIRPSRYFSRKYSLTKIVKNISKMYNINKFNFLIDFEDGVIFLNGNENHIILLGDVL